MIKVFLVEDEIVVREGIKNNVDWSSHGCDFCGEASDGELAFPMIQKLRPDIVITDIKMPFMDGVELSKLIKKELPDTEIVFLSGYAEFEYAKEGIKLGIARYLNKPISSTELLRVVDEIAEKINKRKLEESLKEKYIKDEEEALEMERRDFFAHIVSGEMNASEILDRARSMSIDISALFYNVCLVKMKSKNNVIGEYSPSIIAIYERMSEMANDSHICIFDTFLEGKAILVKGETKEEIADIQKKYCDELSLVMKDYPDITYFVAIGKIVNRIGEIEASYERASYAFAHRFMVDGNGIYSFEDIENNDNQKDKLNLSEIDLKQIERKRVNEFLKTANAGEVRYFVEDFFNNLGTDTLKSNMFRQYIVMDVYFCVCEFVEEKGYERSEIEEFDVTSKALQSVEKTKEYITNIITRAIEIRDNSSADKYGETVREIKEYIENHYFEDELGLNELAEAINFSPNHLSMLFSQETGTTIIKYLTDFRMNKAKELLKGTNKRSSEISLEVGYKDPHYFSFLFKKTQGVTPTQYRNGL